MSLRPMPFLALVTVLGLLAPAAAEPAAAPEAAPTAGALGDTLGEIRARVQALSREAAEAAALRAELATARARIAELETARRTAGTPVTGHSNRPTTDPLAPEDPPVLALLGLAAAMLLGFAAISYWLWRVHRRLRRLVPDDLLDRLVRVEQAHGVLLRMRADRPDWRPPVHPLETHRDGGGTRGRGVGY